MCYHNREWEPDHFAFLTFDGTGQGGCLKMIGGYNAYFEMAALAFMAALTLRFFVSLRFRNVTNRMFGIILICCLLDILTDIVSCVTIAQIDALPVWVNYLTNTLFYVFQIGLPVLMTSYVLMAARRSYREQKSLLWLILPAAAFILVQVLNLVSPGLVFRIAEEDGHRVFRNDGPLQFCFYVCASFYMIATGTLVRLCRDSLTVSERRCIYGAILIIVAAMVVQVVTGTVLASGTAMALSLFLMMFTLQNPQAMVDKASGAFNYNAMVAYMDGEIRKRKPQYIVSVEVEGIGPIDRTMGMVAGNQYVTAVCDFFRTVVPDAWVFRVIGARFLIAVRNCQDMYDAAASIEERFRDPWFIGRTNCVLSAAVMYLQTPADIASTGEFITFLDEAIARFGRSWQGKRVEESANILRCVRRKQNVEEALRKALRENSGLFLNYQPVFSAGDHSFCSAEALLRMETPELGRVSPDEFIRVAEQCGLAPQVDAFVLRQACAFLQENPELKRLEINLSGAEFYHDPTPFIRRILSENDIDPGRICFEITETASAQHPETVRTFMDAMMRLGYTFALDDFGMGYANITQVIHLPFGIVKLDRSLLQENDNSRRLLGGLLSMFSDLGKSTVTEGVETGEQLRFVTENGAVYIQGYYFSKPLSGEDLIKLIRQNAKRA